MTSITDIEIRIRALPDGRWKAESVDISSIWDDVVASGTGATPEQALRVLNGRLENIPDSD